MNFWPIKILLVMIYPDTFFQHSRLISTACLKYIGKIQTRSSTIKIYRLMLSVINMLSLSFQSMEDGVSSHLGQQRAQLTVVEVTAPEPDLVATLLLLMAVPSVLGNL